MGDVYDGFTNAELVLIMRRGTVKVDVRSLASELHRRRGEVERLTARVTAMEPVVWAAERVVDEPDHDDHVDRLAEALAALAAEGKDDT